MLISIIKKNYVANLPNYGNNYYQNVKILTKKNNNKKVDSLWWLRPQTPCLGKIPTQATPMHGTQDEKNNQ